MCKCIKNSASKGIQLSLPQQEKPMRDFFKILRYAIPYKTYALLNIFCNVLSVVFNLLSLILFIPFLRLLFGNVETTYTTVPSFAWNKEAIEQYFNYQMATFIEENSELEALFMFCLAVGCLFLLKNLFRYLAMFFIAVIRNGVVRDIRNKVYNKILILPLSYYSEEKKGDIIARITNDVQEIEWSIMSSLEILFREPLAIILNLTVMVIISPQLTLFSLILLPVSGLIIGRIGKSLKKASGLVQDKMGDLLSEVEETLTGLRIIKAFNAEDSARKKFGTVNNDFKNLMIKMFRKRDLASPLNEFLGSVVMLSLVYFGGSLVLGKDTSLNGEEFVGYIIIFSQLLNPVKSFTTGYANVQKGAASTDRVDKVIKAENVIQEKENAISIESFDDKIEYRNVHFAYEKENVLKAINVSINKGKTVALVGPSGGGKSTMADLLPRFYDTTEGELLIDGNDVKDLKIKDLRNLMGIVTQDSILFNDTIYNNIAFGAGAVNTSPEQVEEAAKIANAHDFITQFEKGYQTNIGDRGDKLSGGQKQRISIARAILKNPPVLILDEATSALDTESEMLVQEALYKLMENRTSLVIAHRLSTIQHADEILVMQQGEIVERGSHDELINKNGVYKKLSDLQTFN